MRGTMRRYPSPARRQMRTAGTALTPAFAIACSHLRHASSLYEQIQRNYMELVSMVQIQLQTGDEMERIQGIAAGHVMILSTQSSGIR